MKELDTQHVQNIVNKDYCKSKGYSFLKVQQNMLIKIVHLYYTS